MGAQIVIYVHAAAKMAIFRVFAKNGKVGNFFESQLQLRRTWTYRNKSSQVKFIQLTKISLVFFVRKLTNYFGITH